MLLSWLKSLVSPPRASETWEELLPGDFVRLHLKDPKSVGIVSDTQSLTYQRLDDEDIRTRQIDGFVTRTEQQGIKPARIDTLEINVVKKRGNNTKLVTYLLLREEIERIIFIEDKKHERRI
jgi:hypothetical protein